MRFLRNRTYPRVDLAKVSTWISSLSNYGLPLLELSSRRLTTREKRGEISSQIKEQLLQWKTLQGLCDPDELEYKYFLDGIDAICERNLNPEDNKVLSAINPYFKDIIEFSNRNIKIYYLSRLGSHLSNFWFKQNYFLYEVTLFWLLIRSQRFDPLLQKMLSDRRFYKQGLTDKLIPSQDGISKSLVKKWFHFFGLTSLKQINKSKLVVLLLFALVFELNELYLQKGRWKEYIGDLCTSLSNRFSISQSAVDFSVLLDYIYSKVNRNILEGYPSGRGHQGLPSKPSVQLLEGTYIPLSWLDSIQAVDLLKTIVFEEFP